MNYCIYLKRRKGKPFCKLLNKEITFSRCQECVNKEYKTKNAKNSFYKKCTTIVKKSTLKRTNALKSGQNVQKLKKQTYKHQKADKKRFSIITNDLEHCIICGAKKDNLHEVFYGSYRHLSIKYGLVIPLCLKHHTMGEFAIHNERELDLYYKRLAQTIFMSRYSYELFMKEFKINYLDK